MKISLVFPIYNEAEILEKSVTKVKDLLDSLNYDYEIILSEDGSSDGSDKLASRIAKNDPRIIHLHSDKRLGKGRALEKAFKIGKGDFLMFMDVDLSTDINQIPDLIKKINEGYDFVVGSRLIKNSSVKRSFTREFASRVYNLFVRVLFDIKIHDLQCGFKAFKRNPMLTILDKIQNKNWFWDTEVIVKGSKMRYKIGEIPLKWEEKNHSKFRLTQDSICMLLNLIKLKIRFFLS